MSLENTRLLPVEDSSVFDQRVLGDAVLAIAEPNRYPTDPHHNLHNIFNKGNTISTAFMSASQRERQQAGDGGSEDDGSAAGSRQP